jgi:serine/threonine-protein kinase
MSGTSLSIFDLRPGHTILDRFLLKGPRRESGIASTFEVHDRDSDSTRELQVFPAGVFEDADQAKEFAGKLEPWASVEVDVLQRVHSVEVLDDGTVLVLADLPEGQDLRDLLKSQGRMEAGDVIALVTPILTGLDVVHGQGLVHGDIKPAAVFCSGAGGEGWLVDGGVTPAMWAAKHLGTRTALIGTPFYAPIEQFTGDSPDELSDLYNLATVMYELLTGVLPWSGRGYIEVFQSKMQETPPSMSLRAPEVEVPQALEEAVARGLFASRRERYPSARVFLEGLSEAVAKG